MSNFVTFDEFISRTADVTLDEQIALNLSRLKEANLTPPPLGQPQADAFNEMRQHILSLYSNVKPEHSFVASDGQYVDCVPIDLQPSVQRKRLRIADPPKAWPTGENRTLERSQDLISPNLGSGTTDEFGNRRSCPDGHVPMRRVTLEEESAFGTLSDFFEKRPMAAGSRDGVSHFHAYGSQIGNNYGGTSCINIWDPQPTVKNFSLSQCWYVGGDGPTRQTIEAGWQVYPMKYRTMRPVLFIYWSTDNYAHGNYNNDSAVFVQTNKSWGIGLSFDQWSVRGGDQKEVRIQWQRDQAGNWWLFLGGLDGLVPVGYYPAGTFGHGPLAKSATRIDFGGEVTGDINEPMGSGSKASDGWQGAAYQRQIMYFPGLDNFEPTRLSGMSEASTYSINVQDYAPADPWTPSLYFGGPSS
jgi:Neprosin